MRWPKPDNLRSKWMAAIHGAGNLSTEIRLARIMRASHIKGWRRGSNLPGKPDFIFGHAKVAVFVDGCFWHGCPFCMKMPKTNVALWTEKISGNRRRDRRVDKTLRSRGWKVLRIWEHSLKKDTLRVTQRVRLALNKE